MTADTAAVLLVVGEAKLRAGGLSVEEVVGAIAAVRARMPIGAFTVASYDPEGDGDGAVGRAVLAALDAALRVGPRAGKVSPFQPR